MCPLPGEVSVSADGEGFTLPKDLPSFLRQFQITYPQPRSQENNNLSTALIPLGDIVEIICAICTFSL